MNSDVLKKKKFNIKDYISLSYFFQNVKSTKGIILALSMLLICVNTIYIFLTCNGTTNNPLLVIQLEEMSYVTLVGLYIYPFTMAALLFSFMFKKKSVDFMCSMPISRKKIYISNMVGGILVIVLLNLINTLVIAITMYTTPNCVAFPQLFIDYFVAWTCYYILFFVISSLALMLVGNIATGIILFLLIITLIPSFEGLVVSNGKFTEYNEYILNDQEKTGIAKIKDEEFRGNIEPYYTYKQLYIDGGSINIADIYYGIRAYKVYNDKVIILSIIFSIIGILVGANIFKKRKMEMYGCSFNKQYIHYLVKSLSLVPLLIRCVTFVSCDMEGDGYIDEEVYIVIFVMGVIMLIFYCIYDRITGFKNGKKVLSSICGVAIVSIIVGLNFYVLPLFNIEWLLENGYRRFNKDEIQSINVDIERITCAIDDEYDDFNDIPDGVKIDDEEFIDEICNIIGKQHQNEKEEHWYGMTVGFALKDGTIINTDDIIISEEDRERLTDIVKRNNIDKDIISDECKNMVYVSSDNCYKDYKDIDKFVKNLNNVKDINLKVVPFDKYVYSRYIPDIKGFIAYDSQEGLIDKSNIGIKYAIYTNHQIQINELSGAISEYTLQLAYKENIEKVKELFASREKFTIKDTLLTFYDDGERVSREINILDEKQENAICEYISKTKVEECNIKEKYFVLTFAINVDNASEREFFNYVIPYNDEFITLLKNENMYSELLNKIG